ncbi:MAG TPA: dTDP-4-dehydrorhamnose 3,5-epimerase [Gemmatimonadales bacterium]|nr:dTDP-4-dehydrorhamnose 3,5-epimerase [Gemmatimonadales bacterium]
MQVIPSPLEGVRVVVPSVKHDARGSFFEAWHAGHYREAGLPSSWAQCNVSHSNRGVLRGLHLQHPLAQAKLVTVLAGKVFDVAVDVRRGAYSYGKWFGTELSGENGHQLFIPDGFAHGFLVLSDFAVVMYFTTTIYEPSSEMVINWNDPRIRVTWPEKPSILSDRDRTAPGLDEVTDRLPIGSF